MSFRLVGPATDILRLLDEKIRLALSMHPSVTHSQASVGGGKPKRWIDLDEQKVRLAGLSAGLGMLSLLFAPAAYVLLYRNGRRESNVAFPLGYSNAHRVALDDINQ